MKWVDELPPKPPRKPTGTGKWQGYVEQLRVNPMVWAECATYKNQRSATGHVYLLRRRYPGCEFVARNGSIYARWHP